MTQKINCPHCGKEVKVSLPPLEDFRIKLIATKWGGLSVPGLVEWIKDNLRVNE